jgi:predicted nucleotidyltransferase
MASGPPAVLERLAKALPGMRGLCALVLFGSRARDDAHARSDWDFGYLGTPGLDAEGLLATLVTLVGSDRVDLVDLQRAGGLLRYRAALDGQVIVESAPGVVDAFRLEAVRFWCDAEPVLRRGYAQVLAGLER